MYKALYRSCRPEVFDQVMGQEHIVKILRNQLRTGSTSHAYLFCGTRGTGKTTTARLLAKGLNCLSDGDRPCGECANCRAIRDGSFIDVIEIDAASNNGVDDIRELRDSVNYPPVMGREKVYIIDEVHMLSVGAANALLKTLEEPPEHVTFILATTELQKIPATILSRCMRLDFKRVPEKVIAEGMAGICRDRGISISQDALRIIAANSDGSVRDGLSILDQCISGGDSCIEEKDVLSFLGASGEEDFLKLTDFVRRRNTGGAIEYLGEILADGKDVRQFIRDWINHYRNLLMTKFVRDPSEVLDMSAENIERISRQSRTMEMADIDEGIMELSKTAGDAKYATQPRILLELAVVRLCHGAGEIRSIPEPPKAAAAPEPVEVLPEVEKQEEKEKAEPADLEKLWDAVFRDGEQASGGFYMLRKDGALTQLDEKDFTVTVISDFKKDFAEKHRALIEDLMEKHTGVRRTMKLAVGKDREKLSAEEIARNASEVLGIEVEVE